MAFDLKSYVCKQVAGARDMVLSDFAVLSDEDLQGCPGGAARSPYNILLELVILNRRSAKRLRGEDPGPFDPKAWATTPDDFQTREAATTQFQESMEEMLAVLEAIPANEIDKEIVLPSGTVTTPFEMGVFCAFHASYHDGQLNYLQALKGDAEIHWN